MCPSMADRNSYTPKPKMLCSEVPANHANPSKYFHHFLYKAIIVTIFLVIVPLLPSIAPEFVNHNLHSRSWELLQLIFVGIAVSYGLFSKRNDESNKEHNNTKFDNAQSYVTRLLQVSSVFDDETESTSVSDENKIQTWNSQYHREEPAVVVAKTSPVLEKHNGVSSRIDEQPLLLPVRSLKSRVCGPILETETSQESSVKKGSISRSDSNSGSKRSSKNSRKSGNGEFPRLISPLNVEENLEENVVLRSPIPWRSRSGRMEMKEDQEGLSSESISPPSFEDSELKKSESRFIRSRSLRSSRPDSTCASPNKRSSPPTPNSPKNLSPLPSFSAESQAKAVEDGIRRKIYVKSSPPPAPPPPQQFIHKSPSMKSNSSLRNGDDFPKKELRRSVRSMPNDSIETGREGLSRSTNSGTESRPRAQNDVSQMGKSVRTIRPSEPVMNSVKSRKFDEDIEATFIEKRGFSDKLMHETAPDFMRQTFTELPKAEKKEYIEKVLVETDDSSEGESENDCFEESVGSSGNEVHENDNAADEGPDVDKKADEFIAKFREQIRLQRIESIRRSTHEQQARKQSR